MESGLDPSLGLALSAIVVQAFAIALLVRGRRRHMRAEAQNQAILACVFADMALVNAHGIIESCNENWTRSRSSRNPFLSAGVGERWVVPYADSVHGPDRERVRGALDAVLSGAAVEQAVEYAWDDGTERRWSQLRMRRLAEPDGGAVVAHLDISSHKRIEDEARLALHELAHMNMRAGMGEVVAAVAHELNQSLTASVGNAQALKRMLARRASFEELAPVVDDIAAANVQATEIIHRIRSMMQKEPFDVQPVDLNTVVLDVVQMLNSSATRDGVLLVADLDPELPRIDGDRVQLRQVAMNLIVNGIQAATDAHSDNAMVRVRTSKADRSVVLAVEDTGSGIPAETMLQLFEPYFTTKAGGLGVGLTISRSIVEAHGGSIQAENLPERGARFVVGLPAES